MICDHKNCDKEATQELFYGTDARTGEGATARYCKPHARLVLRMFKQFDENLVLGKK